MYFMKMFTKVATLFAILLSHVIHCLSYLIPRDNKIWVFIGGHNDDEREFFSDNSKYMFLHTATIPSIRSIWLAQDQKMVDTLRKSGFESYKIKSAKGIFYSLHAGVTFIDAFFYGISWSLSGGTKIIQLWHGKSLVKAGLDKKLAKGQNRFMVPELFTKYYAAVASSPYLAAMTAKNFNTPENRVFVTGLPRTDVFFKSVPGSQIDTHPQLAELAEFKKTHPGKYILYAPTFRRWEFDPIQYLDVAKISRELEKNNAYLFISLHSKRYYTGVDTQELPRSTFIKNTNFDIYPHLDVFDAVIADYGGITMDFVLMNKPVFFFVADFEKYDRENGIYEDFVKLAPGPLIRTTEELLPLLFAEDKWKEKREEMRKIFFTHTDGNAAERITKKLREELKI